MENAKPMTSVDAVSSETIRVFIGTEPKQYVPQQVLIDSILKRTSSKVEIETRTQDLPSLGGTRFGFVRFMIPGWCGFQGKAIYLDADMVVLADIAELWNSLPSDKSVALVQEAQGEIAGQAPKPRNYTSVMVMDCSKLGDWRIEEMLKKVVPNSAELGEGQIHYSDFMTMKWFPPEQIAPLDPRWNHLNLIEPDTKLVHFTHMTTQPWKRPRHRLTRQWEAHLREAIRSGAVKRGEVAAAILKRHMHPRFLFTAVLR